MCAPGCPGVMDIQVFLGLWEASFFCLLTCLGTFSSGVWITGGELGRALEELESFAFL